MINEGAKTKPEHLVSKLERRLRKFILIPNQLINWFKNYVNNLVSCWCWGHEEIT